MNEQQQDAEFNAELWTTWMKKSWKTFEETIRRGRNKSFKAKPVTNDDDDDDDDDDVGIPVYFLPA